MVKAISSSTPTFETKMGSDNKFVTRLSVELLRMWPTISDKGIQRERGKVREMQITERIGEEAGSRNESGAHPEPDRIYKYDLRDGRQSVIVEHRGRHNPAYPAESSLPSGTTSSLSSYSAPRQPHRDHLNHHPASP